MFIRINKIALHMGGLIDPLDAVSPIDGRYRRKTQELSNFFSEKALIKYRIIMEGEYLIALSEKGIGVRNFTQEEKNFIRSLYNPTVEDAQIVKDIETKGYKNIKATNHDVKSIEYYLKDKLKDTSLEDSLEWTHFALTSEDTSNFAYGLMLSNALEQIIIPTATKLYETIEKLAQEYKYTPMLARTHGQPAIPTTFGKEFKIFSARMKKQIEQLNEYKILVKLNGASGNYNAHKVAYPNVDWIEFSKEFINSFNNDRKIKLTPNLITSQIEPHDTYAELFDNMHRLNNILIDFNQDMWRYISDDWIKLKPQEGEVGSSTMPQKVNPIDFENSEGNAGIANALFTYFSTKLPISRLQRDLSDSTVERNFGVAFAHTMIAYNSTLTGLEKCSVNKEKVIKELNNHPEIISEAIQTILRREGVEMPYEQLKELTRGKKTTMNTLKKFIDSLSVAETVKEELKQITPENYTGIASLLVEQAKY